jgi:serine/threonine protein kinase
MAESRLDWGTSGWAMEITKQLKPSLQWVVGDYTVVEEYSAKGRYAMVVKIRNLQNQDYAVKLLINEEARTLSGLQRQIRDANGGEEYVREWELRFSKEVQNMIRLRDCRFVVPYMGCGRGEVDSRLFPIPVFYLVTRFIEGESLETFFNEGKSSLDAYQCLEIAIQLLRAIEYATTQIQWEGESIQIIHRDLGLDNAAVIEKSLGENLSSLLQIFGLDYGIARVQDAISRDPSKTGLRMTRLTLPWETWFPDTHSYRFGVFTDTYSVAMILLDLLFLNRSRDNTSSGMLLPTTKLNKRRENGDFNLDLKNEQRRQNFEKFLDMYLPHIHLEEGSAKEDSTSPTPHLRWVLRRALAFGSRNENGELVFDEENERYHTATDLLNELNASRFALFYQHAKKLLEERKYSTYEQNKRRLEMAMRWDSHEDEFAWNLFGKKLFDLEDDESAYSCFSEAIRIAEQSDRPFPKAYCNRAKLCDVVAAFATSESKAKLYENRAAADRRRAEEAEKDLQSKQASVLPPTDANPTTRTKNK